MDKRMGNGGRFLVAWMVALVGLMIAVGAQVQGSVLTTSQWITPLELDFGPVGLGAISATLPVTITNSGDVPLTGWAGGAVNTPFNASQDCNIAGGVLPGNSCHSYFTFAPTAAGVFSATSTSNTNAGPITILVHGTGVGAQATYHSRSLDFGDVYIASGNPGSASTQVVTITNTGLAPLTDWAGGAVAAPFNASQDCNILGGVLPGNSCHYYFDFSTSAAGTYSATSTSSTNGGAIVVNLSGKAHSFVHKTAGEQVTPRALNFGPVGVGNTLQLAVAVTNRGFANITGWAGGAVSAPFNASQDCNIAGGLPPGSTCYFYYSFNPSAAGAFSAVSEVSDSSGSFSIELQGIGLAPSMTVNPLWLDFGPVALQQQGQQVVTITNTGQTPLTDWAGGAVAQPFNGSQDCNIAGGVLPGQSCHFYYTFAPTNFGAFSATSTFSTNAGTVRVRLQGTTMAGFETYLPLMTK